MQVYGVDLARWWRARRWRALLDLIDQLPMASRFAEAVANDPEQARLIALQRQRSGDDGAAWSPRLAEFDLHARLLRDVINGLLGVQSAVIAAAGAKPPKPEPYPVPVTEIDRAIERATEEWAESLISRLTPWAARGGRG